MLIFPLRVYNSLVFKTINKSMQLIVQYVYKKKKFQHFNNHLKNCERYLDEIDEQT